MKQQQNSYSWEYVPREHIPVSVLRIYIYTYMSMSIQYSYFMKQ